MPSGVSAFRPGDATQNRSLSGRTDNKVLGVRQPQEGSGRRRRRWRGMPSLSHEIAERRDAAPKARRGGGGVRPLPLAYARCHCVARAENRPIRTTISPVIAEILIETPASRRKLARTATLAVAVQAAAPHLISIAVHLKRYHYSDRTLWQRILQHPGWRCSVGIR